MPPDPMKPFHEPIGKLVVNFAFLEAQLNWAIWVLLGTSRGQWISIMGRIINFKARLGLFEVLVRLKTKESTLIKEADAIVLQVETANSNRNNVVHEQWSGVAFDDKDQPRAQNFVTMS